MAAFTSHPMPVTYRQYTTLTKADLPQGRIVEYTPKSSYRVQTTVHEVSSEQTASCHAKSRSRPWVSNPQTQADRRRKLEKMNLRGETRRGSRSSNTPKTNSSCKRSDSATNDSQRSCLTSESLEERSGHHQSSTEAFAMNARTNHMSMSHNDKEEIENLTEDELEDRRRNYDKCMNWMEKLPAKFSGMHIAQERAPIMKDWESKNTKLLLLINVKNFQQI